MNVDGEGGPLLRWVFRGYQAVLSPVLHAVSPTRCKFLPTCSEYAYVAIARHGIWLGSALALRRLARCHPVSAGGFDPVPERKDAAKESGEPGGAGKIHHLS